VLRTFISLPAGVARVPVKRFSLLTVLGCLPWVAALAIAGDALGKNWDKVLKYTHPVTYAVAGLLVVLIGVPNEREDRPTYDRPGGLGASVEQQQRLLVAIQAQEA